MNTIKMKSGKIIDLTAIGEMADKGKSIKDIAVKVDIGAPSLTRYLKENAKELYSKIKENGAQKKKQSLKKVSFGG